MKVPAAETAAGLIVPEDVAAAFRVKVGDKAKSTHPVVAWCDAGTFQPLGKRVLLFSIMRGDQPVLGHDGKPIQIEGSHVRSADFHEVRAIGTMVNPRLGLKVGDRLIHLSSSADPVDQNDPECRWMLVDARDLVGCHRVPVAEVAAAVHPSAREWMEERIALNGRAGVPDAEARPKVLANLLERYDATGLDPLTTPLDHLTAVEADMRSKLRGGNKMPDSLSDT